MEEEEVVAPEEVPFSACPAPAAVDVGTGAEGPAPMAATGEDDSCCSAPCSPYTPFALAPTL